MTTATESHDAQLAAIKARHEDVRAKFNDPGVREVEVPSDMRLEQTGLSSAMVDELGRFWLATGRTMRMVFDPFSLARPGGRNALTMVDLINMPTEEFERLGGTDVLAANMPEERELDDDTQAAQGFKAHEEESPVFTPEEIDRMERRSGAPVPINRIKGERA